MQVKSNIRAVCLQNVHPSLLRSSYYIPLCHEKRTSWLELQVERTVSCMAMDQASHFWVQHDTAILTCAQKLTYICQMPGHILSRLEKGTPSESRLSIGTSGLV